MIYSDEKTFLKQEENKKSSDKKNYEKIIKINESVLQKGGFVSLKDEDQRSEINAEFRAIKHEIMTNAFANGQNDFPNKNLVMLTSALPNEGKTFCAINLALMLSLEKDKSVVLVDADVLKPSIYKTLEFTNRAGLIDYLNDDIANLQDVIYDTSIPNLKILPAGTVSSLSYELLASDKISKLNDVLSEIYGDSIILFDGPPTLGVIETISLSKLVGQTLIIVEHNKTKLSDIKDVTSKLHHNLFTGLIINKSVNSKLGHYGADYSYKNK